MGGLQQKLARKAEASLQIFKKIPRASAGTQ
jgi:hypothetical protein